MFLDKHGVARYIIWFSMPGDVMLAAGYYDKNGKPLFFDISLSKDSKKFKINYKIKNFLYKQLPGEFFCEKNSTKKLDFDNVFVARDFGLKILGFVEVRDHGWRHDRDRHGDHGRQDER